MSTPLTSIDPNALATVTGGGGRPSKGGSDLDGLLDQLSSMAGSIKDIKKKTSGFGQTEMLMLCMLAIQNRPQANVVYVGRRRSSW